MGGWGSTRWVGHQRRLTINEAPCASVSVIRAALTDAGCVGTGRFTIVSADGHRQEVVAKRSPQPFGGWRWSIVCPQCRRGCRALYRPGSGPSWACRLCHRLGHYSQRLNRFWRLNQHLDEYWEQMGGTEDDLARGRWPRRPKKMHRTTYERLKAQWNALNDVTSEEGTRRIARFLARLYR